MGLGPEFTVEQDADGVSTLRVGSVVSVQSLVPPQAIDLYNGVLEFVASAQPAAVTDHWPWLYPHFKTDPWNKVLLYAHVRVAGSAGTKIRLQWTTTPANAASWQPFGNGTDVEIPADTAGFIVHAAPVLISPACVGLVWMRAVVLGGNGVANPVFGRIGAVFLSDAPRASSPSGLLLLETFANYASIAELTSNAALYDLAQVCGAPNVLDNTVQYGGHQTLKVVPSIVGNSVDWCLGASANYGARADVWAQLVFRLAPNFLNAAQGTEFKDLDTILTLMDDFAGFNNWVQVDFTQYGVAPQPDVLSATYNDAAGASRNVYADTILKANLQSVWAKLSMHYVRQSGTDATFQAWLEYGSTRKTTGPGAIGPSDMPAPSPVDFAQMWIKWNRLGAPNIDPAIDYVHFGEWSVYDGSVNADPYNLIP